MAKCGCAQGACSCRFEDSTDVTWSGSGSKSDPFLATPNPLLIVDDTTTLALTLDIDEDTGSLEAHPITPTHVDEFTSDGTWTKPSGVTFARVLMVAGGGGGASGRSGGGSSSRGGGAGDAGGVAILMLIGSAIPASAAVEIGQGGAGGASVTASNGTAGGDGGDTKFGARLVRGGVGGQPLGLAGNHLAEGDPPGQKAVDDDEIWDAAHPYLAPGAGGSGAGVAFSPNVGGFSIPGQGRDYPDPIRFADVGEDGPDELVTKMGGGGGGGDEAEAGGNGGLYGGGGGGGGFESNSSDPSGAGGNGADGYLVVISW